MPMTPQLALRVALAGSLALLLFAVVFFRLWYLQVLSGSTYVAQAQSNVVRDVPVLAPRGEIIDRSGNVLVSSQAVPAVVVSPTNLRPQFTLATLEAIAAGQGIPAGDLRVLDRIARVLGISTAPMRKLCHIAGQPPPKGPGGNYRLAPIPCAVAQSVAVNGSFQNVTIRTNVTPYLQQYLAERQREFPGVLAQLDYVRQYPLGPAGAQLFGSVQDLSLAEQSQRHFRGIPPYDQVGQSGLEYTYNADLEGHDGTQPVKVSAQGTFEGYGVPTPVQAGDTLQTTLSASLERTGQQSLETSIAANPGATGGAFVALDPRNGQVLAMGSAPSYDPSVFTHSLSVAEANSLFHNPSDPLFNRAIQSAGPTGSTFKPITATAALQSGVWSPGETFDDTGQLCFTGGLCLHNAGHVANGVLDLVGAIRVSDDVFFYNLGRLLNSPAPQGGALQRWARAYGIGRPTGIDLPGEATGTLPSPSWRAHRNLLERECETATGPFAYTNGTLYGPRRLAGWHRSPRHVTCGIADGAPWTVGDNVNLGVGQGDVQVTPLQLAVAYAALANGGEIVTPHAGMDIRQADGTIVQRIDPGPRRRLTLDPTYRATILQGLHEAAQSPGGTSYDVMHDFPMTLYGKTGTAQYVSGGVEHDYAWYACFVPPSETQRPIVIVVTVERGGFGDVAAAPVARQMLNEWFFGRPGAYHSGSSATL